MFPRLHHPTLLCLPHHIPTPNCRTAGSRQASWRKSFSDTIRAHPQRSSGIGVVSAQSHFAEACAVLRGMRAGDVRRYRHGVGELAEKLITAARQAGADGTLAQHITDPHCLPLRRKRNGSFRSSASIHQRPLRVARARPQARYWNCGQYRTLRRTRPSEHLHGGSKAAVSRLRLRRSIEKTRVTMYDSVRRLGCHTRIDDVVTHALSAWFRSKESRSGPYVN